MSTTTTTTESNNNNYFLSAELSRLMVPADANPAGNVHGGVIMQLLEEAAWVAASRFYNRYDNVTTTQNGNNNHERMTASDNDDVVRVLTVRVENITFEKPLHVGDVAKAQARVVFTSEHTVAVAVKLLAERWHSTQDIVSNQALLWVVGRKKKASPSSPGENNGEHTHPVERVSGIPTVQNSFHSLKGLVTVKPPQLKSPSPTAEENKEILMASKFAALAYKMRKADQKSDPAGLPNIFDEDNSNTSNGTNSGEKLAKLDDGETKEKLSPEDSTVELCQVMVPADSASGSGLVRGGLVMLMMDNASGVAAARHCGTNVVTVSVDAVDFVAPVVVGDVLKVRAQPVSTSNKSIEVEVVVTAERFALDKESGKMNRFEIVTTQQAYFTFVSLGSSGKVLPMPPLEPKTTVEKVRFQQGQKRYEQRKAVRSGGGKGHSKREQA